MDIGQIGGGVSVDFKISIQVPLIYKSFYDSGRKFYIDMKCAQGTTGLIIMDSNKKTDH